MLRPALFAFICLFLSFSVAQAQEEAPQPNLDALKVGDPLTPEDGVYWNLRGEEGMLNLRFVGTRLRLYFVDGAGELIEPPYPIALVRYENAVRTGGNRQLTKLTLAGDGLYLASPRVIPQPLRYRVWVLLKTKESDGEEKDTQSYPQRILSGLGQ
ncbi:MAG: hypothetical protein ACQKBW_02920 [Puniceicoccales bacterium]